MKNRTTSLVLILMVTLASQAFGYFATTTISPSNQTVEAGDVFNANINWAVNYNADPTIAIEAWLSFDPSVLQVVSVTGSGTPFSNVEINSWDNTAGTIHYKASGGSLNSGNYTMATLQFEAIAAGTSQIYFNNVNQIHQNYGVSGVNGAASGASVEVTAAPVYGGTLSRTLWEMHAGFNGIIEATWNRTFVHGHPSWYTAAVVPGATDGGWGPAPNGETIGFGHNGASQIDEAGYSCWEAVDYTYFQTFVNVPTGTELNTFTISFSGMDDGSRITIYNSDYPLGLLIPGSYVYLGATATSDLASYVTPGENRVVITQMDDCPTGNKLQVANVVLNGEVLVPEDPNTPPTADAGGDQTIDCAIGDADVTLSGSGSDADGDNLSYSWTLGGAEVSTDASFDATLGGGSHTYTLTVSDGTDSASDDVTVTVNLDETAPEIAAIEDITVSNDPGLCGAEVSFTVSAEDDCGFSSVVADPVSGSLFEVGTTTVTITATDAAGNTSESTFDVTVNDTEAPTFTTVDDPSVMWSPNHKYRTFDAADFVASVDDNCSDLTAADVTIDYVTSDEEEDSKAKGNKGDGNTKNDMVINGSSVDLRSERQGGGNGRVYTIYMSITDGNGNSSTASAQVHVTHNKKSTAIDDGAVYTVNASALARSVAFEDMTNDMLIPEDFALDQNYPNPFNPSTMINYSMPEAGHASLIVYDIRGSVAAQLSSGYQSAGIHSISFDASALTAGSYIYVLNVNGQRFTRKMLLLK